MFEQLQIGLILIGPHCYEQFETANWFTGDVIK